MIPFLLFVFRFDYYIFLPDALIFLPQGAKEYRCVQTLPISEIRFFAYRMETLRFWKIAVQRRFRLHFGARD